MAKKPKAEMLGTGMAKKAASSGQARTQRMKRGADAAMKAARSARGKKKGY